MKMKVAAMLVLVGMLLTTAQLFAHHSFAAEFDEKKTITITGTITKVEMTNPHGWLYLNVKGPDGRVKNYGVETGAPAALIRRGGDRKTLAIGSTIIVDGWLARDGSNTVNGRTIKTADGKNINAGTSNNAAQ